MTRAEYASLLYWLVPGVRSGAAGSGRIATDILDLPSARRREIARVVNRELMSIDTTQHRFHPGRTVNRGEALRALLAVLAADQPVTSCVARGAGYTVSPEGVGVQALSRVRPRE